MVGEVEFTKMAGSASERLAEPTDFIRKALSDMGADVVGFADFARYDREIMALGEDVPKKYPIAISFGFLVSKGVLETLVDGPTPLYLHHYRQVNYRLDMTAYLLAKEIEARGHRALPLAASQMVDWQRQLGHISHKHVGVAAGVGWIGRNNLLVHPRFGARVRYNTVLTDMPLITGEPLSPGCGDCSACVSSCPAQAIREDAGSFDHLGCFEMLQVFKNKRNLGHHICGLCVNACGGNA
jgi:epoxyqueuosine reductase